MGSVWNKLDVTNFSRLFRIGLDFFNLECNSVEINERIETQIFITFLLILMLSNLTFLANEKFYINMLKTKVSYKKRKIVYGFSAF